MIQRISTFLFAVVIAFFPFASMAADLRMGEQVSIKKGDNIRDVYIAGGDVSSSGDIGGDFLAAGGNISLVGNVSDDAAVVGGSLTLTGFIGDDLRVVGGDVFIGGTVMDDVAAVGGQIHIVSGAEIGGDVVAAGGRVVVEGTVGGDVRIVAGEVRIDDVILGNVDIKADKVTLGSSAIIQGNFTYTAREEAVIENGAVVAGEVVFTERMHSPVKTKEPKAFLAGLFGVFFAIRFIMFLVAALVLGLLFTKFSEKAVKIAMNETGKEFMRGLVVLIVVPIASFLLLVSLVGTVLGGMGFLGFLFLVGLAKIYASIIFGAWLQKKIMKTNTYEVQWKSIVGGVFALTVITMIPVVGWIFGFLMLLLSLGTLSRLMYERIVNA